MNKADENYIALIRDILENGTNKEDRTGTGTKSVFGRQMRFNLQEGFPLLTCKKTHFKSVVHENIWFLSGSTNTKYLTDNKVTIWNEWANEDGDLGPVYGHQWRNFNGTDNKKGVDQIQQIIDQLNNNPDSRRIIVCAWNPEQLPEMALPPCHAFFQFYSEPLTKLEKWALFSKQCLVLEQPIRSVDDPSLTDSFLRNNNIPLRKLSLQLYQRSCDAGLGLPFNIAGYSLLLMMVAHVTGHLSNEFIWTGGDTHIYNNHIESLTEIFNRPNIYKLPKVKINPLVKNINDFKYEDIELVDYKSYPVIKLPVAI